MEHSDICDKLKHTITNLRAYFDQYDKLPCFSLSFNDFHQSIGWTAPKTSLRNIFKRMGIPNDQWEFTDINEDYKVSESYPSVIVVPQGISKSKIKGSAGFRSRNRFPALTYYYSPKGSALCRCSQPLSGLSTKSNEDIAMLSQIKDVAFEEHTNILHIVDARSKVTAVTNRVIGKGYEIKGHYNDIAYHFSEIENIHVMRASLKTFLRGIRKIGKIDSSSVGNTEWFQHLALILKSSRYIVEKLKRGENVIVHCSDGWDRTAQLCSLAQIIIDPYYRTINGLADIIEKDWLAFGHKFNNRCSQLSNVRKTDVSPIFLQFLDCIYQLTNLYPDQFEFNELFLRHLHRWSQDSVFGTFIGNSEKERLSLKLHQNTYSVWGYIKHNINHYKNPNYNANTIIPIIDKPLMKSKFVFWRSIYYPLEEINGFQQTISNDETEIQLPIDYDDNFLLVNTLNENKSPILNHAVNTSKKKKFSFKENFHNLFQRNKKSIYDKLKSVILTYNNQSSIDKVSSNNARPNSSNSTINEDYQLQIRKGTIEKSIMNLENKCQNCNTTIRETSLKQVCRDCFAYLCQVCFQENEYSFSNYSFSTCTQCLLDKNEHNLMRSSNDNTNLQHVELQRDAKQTSNDPLLDYIQGLKRN